MTLVRQTRSYGRYVVAALAAIAFGTNLQWKEHDVTAIRHTRAYGRYVLSTLSAITFGITAN